MAWKELSEMKKEDQLYEMKKQAMIVSQNALSHATQIILSRKGGDLSADVKLVKETAEDLTLWVYGQSEILTNYMKIEPKLTAEQQKVKEAVEGHLGRPVTVDELKDWAAVKGYPNQLPKNMNSVNEIVKFLKG